MPRLRCQALLDGLGPTSSRRRCSPLALEPLAFGRALIRIEADEAVRLEVRYGAGGLEWTAVQPSFSPSPSLLLAGLDAATTYTLSVMLTDPAGNAVTVSGLELTTPPAPDTQAPSISSLAVGPVTDAAAAALYGAALYGARRFTNQEVSGEETLSWEGASILAPIAVLPHEFPELRPWSADVLRPAAGSRAETRLAADLLREFGREERVSEVVYRRGHRYVRSFEPLELSAEDTMLHDDGVYLITDGSAGFGLAFGEFLAQAVRAQLVLASSVELPAKDAWPAWLEEHGESDETSVRIRRILALEEQGARVFPIAADITDVERMKAVVEECVERFGRLDGVIHAPAEAGSQAALLPVTEIDGESFAGRIHQRVRGAAVLAEALGEREPDFCLLIASLSSVLGGVGMVADVAADCCLELLARSASRDAATVWRSILWDNEGDGAMRPEDGVAALQRLLCSQFLPCIAVSTVDLEARIDLRYAEPEKADEAVASRRPRPQLESVYAAPEDELEEAIGAIWEELFGIGGLGVDDDFFALGGHSLLATQLVSRVRDQFEVELLLREALEMPTIRQLAVVVAEKQTAAGGGDLEQFLDQLEGMSDEEAREI